MTSRTSSAEEALEGLRTACFAMPGTTEKLSHGTEAFFVRGKMFAMFANEHHGSSRTGAWLKSSLPEQKRLVASAPERFFVPPYVGVNGWVGLWLDAPSHDAGELAILVEEAWLAVAPKSAHADPIAPPPDRIPRKAPDPRKAAEARARLDEVMRDLDGVTTDEGTHRVTYRVRKKPFAYFYDHAFRDVQLAVGFKTSPENAEKLVRADPKRYFVPPYTGVRGWIAMRLDVGKPDFRELAERLSLSHALAAGSASTNRKPRNTASTDRKPRNTAKTHRKPRGVSKGTTTLRDASKTTPKKTLPAARAPKKRRGPALRGRVTRPR